MRLAAPLAARMDLPAASTSAIENCRIDQYENDTATKYGRVGQEKHWGENSSTAKRGGGHGNAHIGHPAEKSF